jgi:hypothetical protein
MINWLRDVRTTLLLPHGKLFFLADGDNCPWQEVAPSIDVDIPEWLQEYVSFHKAAIANAKKEIGNVTNSYLIFFCKNKMQCSGTANQQRAISAALMVSILTRRIFLIDIDQPVRLDQILSPNLLEWNYDRNMTISNQSRSDSQLKMNTEIIHARNVQPPVLNFPSRFLTKNASQVIFIVTNGPPSLNSLWKTKETRSFLAKYNMSNEIFPKQIYKWLFNSLYKPSKLLKAHMVDVRDQLSLSWSSTYVGVHIRTGDENFHHKKLKRHGHGQREEDLQEFVTCANKIKNYHLGKDVPIVLVTDNPGTRVLFSRMDPFVRYANTSIVHTDLSHPSVNNLEGNLNVWSDIFLLAQANYTVISRGSFSELGRRLGAPYSPSVMVSSCTSLFVNISS